MRLEFGLNCYIRYDQDLDKYAVIYYNKLECTNYTYGKPLIISIHETEQNAIEEINKFHRGEIE